MGFCGSMGIYGCHGYLWVFMGHYGCLWIFMSGYGCHGYLWVSVGVYGSLWMFMGIYECTWMSWVSMGIYGWHECLWVLYLNIKNIAYFLIQEPKKI